MTKPKKNSSIGNFIFLSQRFEFSMSQMFPFHEDDVTMSCRNVIWIGHEVACASTILSHYDSSIDVISMKILKMEHPRCQDPRHADLRALCNFNNLFSYFLIFKIQKIVCLVFFNKMYVFFFKFSSESSIRVIRGIEKLSSLYSPSLYLNFLWCISHLIQIFISKLGLWKFNWGSR